MQLYYLSPYDLLNPVNLIFGRSICVESCPASAFTCGLGELPCTDASSFRCPYYQVAEHSLYGTLQGVGDWDTNYWAQLNTTSKAQCPAQVTVGFIPCCAAEPSLLPAHSTCG